MKTFKMNRSYLAIIILFAVVSTFSLQAKTIYYVTTTGTGDGSSWANAANNIQALIDKAVSGDEVWVAKGTYYPTTETIARDPRSATFLLKDGVSLYGGFFGNESTILQRALSDLDGNGKIDSCELSNPTILSGDVDGVADVLTTSGNSWTISGNSGNCYRVVTSPQNFINITLIDGFTITGGNANTSSYNEGGGINANMNTYIENCIIMNCNALSSGGGVMTVSTIMNSVIRNCSSSSNGGGIFSWSASSSVVNCNINNCYSLTNGGGIYSSINSNVSNCLVINCSTSTTGCGGGIYSKGSMLTNCLVMNCQASTGGGISTYCDLGYDGSFVSNCTVTNCAAGVGGGIYTRCTYSFLSSQVTNCVVANCSNVYGGIFMDDNTKITNCSASNNWNGTKISNVDGFGYVMSPDINITYIKPTSFIGIASSTAQLSELYTSNWRLKEGSPCINAGTTNNISSGKDIDNNPRVLYGTIDIGAYEYVVPTISMPISEKFDTITSWDTSPVFYNSASINGGLNILWTLVNQKADFSWQTNLTSGYSQPIFTYQIDGTNTSKVYLRYDMYFQAYAGTTITPLGTEKLNVEFSTDLITWNTIATYSNANGTIANQTYKYDISALAAGKTFFIRFNANGANSNLIEKWEIDNVIIDADGLSAVNTVQENKYKYSINDGNLIISNLGQESLVQLYDVNGRLISAKNSASQMFQFMLPTHGVYVVKVVSDSGIENKKIVW